MPPAAHDSIGEAFELGGLLANACASIAGDGPMP